ncbi:hypothetical protein DH2020_014665 [Rehmannia glutinosa]|uniref:Protein kinase domain-containing protein n=1 Tax=Rehmannia glutinosa TaxID=99300 RepID=A0ABR0WXT0_REHGL
MAAVRLLLIPLLIFSFYTPVSLSIGEDVHLIEFKESLKVSSALDSSWISGTNPCDRKKAWQGVDCSDTGFKTVSALLLMNLGLSGAAGDIDIDALSNLENLRFLSLENNTLSGPMPEFNRLSSLKSLFLSGNQLSGEIPPDYFNNMGSLKKLQLARNKFSGKIPDSLLKLGNIMEIQLQQNEFSGPVPSFEQKSLQTIDLSYNKLQGEIPQSMSRFPARAFEGNPDVCGSVVSKACAKKEGDNFSVFEEGEFRRGRPVHMPSSARRSMSSSRRGGNSFNDTGSQSSKRGAQGGKSANDLVVINEEKGVFGLPDLMKAAAEVLGSGGLGSAYKAVMANGVSVVVKRMRDMNKLNKDAFEAEIRRLGRIRHRNILPPLAYHYRKEEKLLVTEFIPKGSLLFLLHDYALYSLISNTQSVQAQFAYKCPEAVLYQQLSPKSDVYCLGITKRFREQLSELIDPEIANASDSLDQMEKMLYIAATCTESDHEKRIEMREAIRNIEEVQA